MPRGIYKRKSGKMGKQPRKQERPTTKQPPYMLTIFTSAQHEPWDAKSVGPFDSIGAAYAYTLNHRLKHWQAMPVSKP